MPKIFIGTPTPRHEISADFHTLLRRMENHLARSQITSITENVPGYDQAEQKDFLAHLFLQTDCTHILFADSDEVPDADLCSVLLDHGKEFVAAAYPNRTLDLKVFAGLIAKGLSFDIALARAYEFHFRPMKDGTITRAGNLFKIGAVGMGLCLVARPCFERLKDRPSYRALYQDKPIVRDFFSRTQLPNGHRQTEDFSFCDRVTEAGGEIWAYSSATKIGHIGTMVHRASFADHVEALKEQNREPASPVNGARPAPPRASR